MLDWLRGRKHLTCNQVFHTAGSNPVSSTNYCSDMSQLISTYTEFKMDDKRSTRYNSPWEIGTLRVQIGSSSWLVSPRSDPWWTNARDSWADSGEYYDGVSWKPLPSRPACSTRGCVGNYAPHCPFS
jgi:hypothetical protein